MTDDEKYYEDLRMMFTTDGWKSLLEELENNAKIINSVLSTKDDLDLQFRKGQLNIIGSILNLEETVKNNEEAANG
jgi:hypothetical protein